MRIDCESITKPVLTKESSRASLGDVEGATEGPSVPSEQAIFNLIAQKCMESTRPSNPEEFDGFLHYLEQVRKVLIVDAQKGSVVLILACTTLGILEGLWEDYNKGHVNEVAQIFLVTDDIIEEFGEVKLTTTISEEEYQAARDYFLQGSGKFKGFYQHVLFLQ